MQLMPATARQYAVSNPYDPSRQYRGGDQTPQITTRSLHAECAASARRLQRGRSRRAALRRHPAVSGNPRLRLSHPADPWLGTSAFRAFPAAGRLTFEGPATELLRRSFPRSWYNLRATNVHADNPLQPTAAREPTGGGRLTGGIPLPDRVSRQAKSAKACMPPTAKRASGTTSKRRIFTFFHCSPRARLRGFASPSATGRHSFARVSGLQPGIGDAAQGGHAARAVARSTQTPRGVASLPRRARRCLREGAIGNGAFGGVRGARVASADRLYGLAAGGRAERQPGHRAAAFRRILEDHRNHQAQDDLGPGLPGHPHVSGAGARHGHRRFVVPAFSSFYTSFGAPRFRSSRASSSASRISFGASFCSWLSRCRC